MTKRRATRELLWRWGNTEVFCKERESELGRFEQLYDDLLVKVKCMELAGDRRPIGKHSDPVAMTVIKYEDILREYAETVEDIKRGMYEAIQFKRKIDSWVSFLPLIQQRILVCRYVMHMKWGQIEARMAQYEHSLNYLKELEANALDKLLRKIPENFF